MTTGIRMAKAELHRLQELRDRQRAKVQALQDELGTLRGRLGQVVLQGLNDGAEDPGGLAATRVRDLVDRQEAEMAALAAIQEAIAEAAASVDRERALSWRQDAAMKQRQLDEIIRKRDALLEKIFEVEQTKFIRVEGYGAPPPLSTRLAYEISQLQANATRLESGQTPLPIQQLPVIEMIPG